jgi:hypothetical protein
MKAGIFHTKPLDLMILPEKSNFNRIKTKAAWENPRLMGLSALYLCAEFAISSYPI